VGTVSESFRSTGAHVDSLAVRAAVILKALSVGPGRETFSATSPSGELVVKVYAEGYRLRREVEVIELARAIGLPAPEVLNFVAGPPAVIVMRKLAGHPLASGMGDEPAVEAGAAIRRFHDLGASPPYSGGHLRWDEFVFWWAKREAQICEQAGLLTNPEAVTAFAVISSARDQLRDRPTVLMHGDLQREHVLVEDGHLSGLIDFVDAQPGDGMIDLAVLTLWDEALTEPLLRGYGLVMDGEVEVLLARYRLLRHLAGAAWLADRNRLVEAGSHITKVRLAIGDGLPQEWMMT
jgi:aminoglycoside phosphotransferase (APT) family kinase protein